MLSIEKIEQACGQASEPLIDDIRMDLQSQGSSAVAPEPPGSGPA